MRNDNLEEHAMRITDCEKCVACESKDVFEFFRIEDAPVNVGYLATTETEARNAPRGKISLCYCRSCGLVYNRNFDPSLIRFSEGYDASLVHSPSFAQANRSTAESLIQSYNLCGKSVFEIGCGQAHLLRELCDRTTLRAIGTDPTATPVFEQRGSSTLEVRRSKFDETHSAVLGDLIILISVIEDIPEPLAFLSFLRRMIGDRNLPMYLEFFDGFNAIEAGSVWSPHYEQGCYFGKRSIENLLWKSGFDVVSSGLLTNCSQYRCVSAVASSSVPGSPGLDLDHSNVVEKFATIASEKCSKWGHQLSKWKRNQRRVFLWGSGGKAISFLSMVPESEMIQGVVDINPNRQGRYTPISTKRVLSADQLCEQQPDAIIVSNPAYKHEIADQLKACGLTCELFIA